MMILLPVNLFSCCKANTRVKLAKTGHDPHSSTLFICVVRLLFVLFSYCLCVNVYCHRVTTQLQIINIRYRAETCSCVPNVLFCVKYIFRNFPFEHHLTLRRLMSYIYMKQPFLMFLDHTQRRSTVGRTPLDE